ncbi:kinesin-like protein KIN-14I isoform X2 [Nymphaea colorata]|uniref:kinesin-like protein KIN-14I isoform X2 n=1 Tax=Nymphaea colorata TaxID=210225 RepID=UPI00129D6DEE|nr:kinesin-like protein KIN-14I isoform X2 [Nymphaea colorata]
MASESVLAFPMSTPAANSDNGKSFCASVVEEVLQQHTVRLNGVNLASRKAEETVTRRYEAAGWLRKMVGVVASRDLPNEPTEEEFLLGLRSGSILCNALNKVHAGAVSKVVETPVDSVQLPDGAALSAYQYFENVRNFLDFIEEMGLPAFEACDLEKGGSCTKVVNCILALKSYHEWRETGANGSFKFGSNLKPPTNGRCVVRVGKNSEPFMNSPFRNTAQVEPSGQSVGRYSDGFPMDLSLGPIKMGGANHSLDILVRALLSDKKPEEVPIIVESMLTKVMEEFERRLSSESEQIKTAVRDLPISDDKKSLSKDNLAALSSAFGEAVEDTAGEAREENLEDVGTTSGQEERKDECFSPTSSRKEENERHLLKQKILFDQQKQEIKELKNTLQVTKEGIQTMQARYCEEFYVLGRHLKSLTDAAASYHKVVEENRQLYNQVQDLKGSIRVYCRVRPFLPGQQSGLNTVEHIGDGNITISNPLKQDKGSRKSFTFNKVFGPSASQEEVFFDTQPLVRSILDGYNVCIFAYGQTGSGKTYTMMGPKQITAEGQGVNYRALSDLFHISEQRKDTFTYEISVQMMEIYNEQVRDLLASDGNRRLEIRNSSQQNGFNVPDANLVPVKSTTDVIELMNIGQKNRAVSATAMNDRSSRSHSCLTVHVQGRDKISGTVLRGSLHLVDLAGSERVDKSEVIGERLKEAQHINKSLSALGDVIAALAQKNSHVPYRNSKLTQLLQDSLGGQAKTLMFVHISPEVDAFGETISTLKFAERVSTIELGAARVNKDGKEVRELREQIASLKAALARKEAESDQHRSTMTSPDRQMRKHSMPSLMQGGHSSYRQPMEDVRNVAQEISIDSCSPPWPDNILPKGDVQKPGEDWVNKVKQESGDAAMLRYWDNNDNNSVPEMFYGRCVADMRKVYPEQCDQFPMNHKEPHENNTLKRFDSMSLDDMDDIEVATSDSSEADMLWQLNVPNNNNKTHNIGSKMKKTQSKIHTKSSDVRNVNQASGPKQPRRPSDGGGNQLQRQASAGPDQKRSTAKLGRSGR